jgi:hypothetical protein
MHLVQYTDQWQVVVNTIGTFGFHKRLAYVDQLSDYWLLKKDSAPWS